MRQGPAASRHTEPVCTPELDRKRAGSRLWQFLGAAALLTFVRFYLYGLFVKPPSTLVIYVAGYEDPENLVNVNFFLTQGIK